MKQAILAVLARLTNAMKTASQPLHAMFLPIIKGAIEPGSDTQVYLLDDALDLWASILGQTKAPANSEIISLAFYLLPLYELGTESLRKALEITESYILLAPSEILSDPLRDTLHVGLAGLLSAKASVDGTICKLLEMLIRAAVAIAGEHGLRIECTALIDSGLLSKMIEGIHGNWQAHQTTGPNRKDPSLDWIIETDYLALLSRIAYADPNVFVQVIHSLSSPIGQSSSDAMEWLLSEWLSHFSDMDDIIRKKLMCLSLTRLLSTAKPVILTHLQELMNIWIDVCLGVREDDADIGGDALVYDISLVEGSMYDSAEDVRKRELIYSDPVHTVNVCTFVRECFNEAVRRVGGEQKFQEDWLVNVDKTTIDGVKSLGVF